MMLTKRVENLAHDLQTFLPPKNFVLENGGTATHHIATCLTASKTDLNILLGCLIMCLVRGTRETFNVDERWIKFLITKVAPFKRIEYSPVLELEFLVHVTSLPLAFKLVDPENRLFAVVSDTLRSDIRNNLAH